MNFKVTSIEKVVPSCTGSHEAHLTMQETRERAWNSHIVECAVTICEVARIDGFVRHRRMGILAARNHRPERTALAQHHPAAPREGSVPVR